MQRALLFDKNLQLVHELQQAENQNNKSTVKNNIKSLSIIDDDKKAITLSKIEGNIKNQFYLNKNTTLVSFAEDIDTNTTYLSKIVNDEFHKPFAHFVNDLRIKFMLLKIENDILYSTYKIEFISDNIGFASSSIFYTAFKKQTGLIPSYYIKKRVKLVG